MKVVAYSIKPFEREPLAKANQKKHDITLIFNSLNLETALFAAGKQAVMVSASDNVTEDILSKLAQMGVKYITMRSNSAVNIDKLAAARNGIKLANVPEQMDIANQTIKNLDLWEMNKCVGKACSCAKDCKR